MIALNWMYSMGLNLCKPHGSADFIANKSSVNIFYLEKKVSFFYREYTHCTHSFIHAHIHTHIQNNHQKPKNRNKLIKIKCVPKCDCSTQISNNHVLECFEIIDQNAIDVSKL